MNRSPSQYGGVAAVLVFGIGAMIVGFSMPPGMQERASELRLMGAVMTVFGLLVLGLVTASSPAWKAMFVAIAAAIYCALCVYEAASNESTGTATYHANYFARHEHGVPVTRSASPDKFRTATNVIWVGSGLFFMLATGSAIYSRRCWQEE